MPSQLFPGLSPYPKEVLALQSTDGFRDAVLRCVKHCNNSYTEAFEFVNDEYTRLFGEPKYRDYDSYKSSISYHRAKYKPYDDPNFKV